jgi:hypothetical protein
MYAWWGGEYGSKVRRQPYEHGRGKSQCKEWEAAPYVSMVT